MSLLYPEIIDVIIEDIAADMRSEIRGWLNGPIDHDISAPHTPKSEETITTRAVLMKCSLISKAWYFRAGKYIWRTITVDGRHSESVTGLVDFLAERPDIVTLIKHVDLRASWDDHALASECIDGLSRIISPVATISLIYSPKSEERYYRWDNSFKLPHHPFLSTLTLPSTLNNLTSLHYEGEIFPIMLLEHTPNLRDLSLQGAMHSDVRKQSYLRAFDKPVSDAKLSFRLDRAHFGKLDQKLLAELVKHHPKVFSQLKELYFADFLQNYEAQQYRSPKDLPSLTLLMLARNTLETLAVGLNRVPRFSMYSHYSFKSHEK